GMEDRRERPRHVGNDVVPVRRDLLLAEQESGLHRAPGAGGGAILSPGTRERRASARTTPRTSARTQWIVIPPSPRPTGSNPRALPDSTISRTRVLDIDGVPRSNH